MYGRKRLFDVQKNEQKDIPGLGFRKHARHQPIVASGLLGCLSCHKHGVHDGLVIIKASKRLCCMGGG